MLTKTEKGQKRDTFFVFWVFEGTKGGKNPGTVFRWASHIT